MGIDAALADQSQLWQSVEQWRADLRALADQDERLGGAQPTGERVHVLNVVVPDRDLVPAQLLEAAQRADRIEVVVEDGDLHGLLGRDARRARLACICVRLEQRSSLRAQHHARAIRQTPAIDLELDQALAERVLPSAGARASAAPRLPRLRISARTALHPGEELQRQ